MELGTIIFASILVAVGLFLILHLRAYLRGESPAAAPHDRQQVAYEERHMRVRRDRVWWRVESLYSEFTEREAAGRLHAARDLVPQPRQGGSDSQVVTSGDVRAAYDQFIAAHDGRQDRRDETPGPPRN